MRIINGLIYIVIAWAIAEFILYRKNRRITKFGEWLQCYPYLIIMLCVVNSVSFALTFYEKTGDITIYREGFGGGFSIEKGRNNRRLYADRIAPPI